MSNTAQQRYRERHKNSEDYKRRAREHRKRSRLKNLKKEMAYGEAYRAKNRDEIRKKAREYYYKRLEKDPNFRRVNCERVKKYRARDGGHAATQKQSEYLKNYRKRNPEKIRQLNLKRTDGKRQYTRKDVYWLKSELRNGRVSIDEYVGWLRRKFIQHNG